MLAVADLPSMRNHFRDETPFKVQVNFYIPLFGGQIDVGALCKLLNVLEGYFYVHNFFDRENITFSLLKEIPRVQNWWGTYWEKNSSYESRMFETNTTWVYFMDAIKEHYYPLENYDD